MNTDISYGRQVVETGYFDGAVKSERTTKSKSIKIDHLHTAQEKMLSYSKELIEGGISDEVYFKIVADKVSRVPKRIEVSWVTERQIVPVRNTIAKA